MNKRRHPRLKGANLEVIVSDGDGFFSGYVNDVSRFGMLLTDVSLKLNRLEEKLSIIISGKGKNFKMMAIPKWEVEDGGSKMMGVELVNVPFAWAGFIRKFEPKDERIYAMVTH